jgi:hypothetical protein
MAVMRADEYNPTFPKQISEIPNLYIIIIITISTYNKTVCTKLLKAD